MIPRFRAARSALAIAVAAIALGGAPARAQLYLPALGQLPDAIARSFSLNAAQSWSLS